MKSPVCIVQWVLIYHDYDSVLIFTHYIIPILVTDVHGILCHVGEWLCCFLLPSFLPFCINFLFLIIVCAREGVCICVAFVCGCVYLCTHLLSIIVCINILP